MGKSGQFLINVPEICRNLSKIYFFFSYLLLLQGILKLSSWEDLTPFWFVAEPWTVFCMWSESFFPLPAGVGKTHTET